MLVKLIHLHKRGPLHCMKYGEGAETVQKRTRSESQSLSEVNIAVWEQVPSREHDGTLPISRNDPNLGQPLADVA